MSLVGPLAVRFRLIGKAPASCRGVSDPETYRSLVQRPAPVFPPETFLPNLLVINQHLISVNQSAARAGRQEAGRVRPGAEPGFPAAAYSSNTHRKERSKGRSNRHSNNGDGDNPMSSQAGPA